MSNACRLKQWLILECTIVHKYKRFASCYSSQISILITVGVCHLAWPDHQINKLILVKPWNPNEEAAMFTHWPLNHTGFEFWSALLGHGAADVEYICGWQDAAAVNPFIILQKGAAPRTRSGQNGPWSVGPPSRRHVWCHVGASRMHTCTCVGAPEVAARHQLEQG